MLLDTSKVGAFALALVAACASSGSTDMDDSGPPGVTDQDTGTPVADAKAPETGSGSDLDAGATKDAPSTQTDAGAVDAADPTYAVGVTTRTWVDSQRPTPQNGSEAAKPNRTLVTEIWYPASGASSTTGTPTATRDAPLAQGGPFPLVFFVHGSSSGRLFYTYLTLGLAKAGYVVAAADFPLTALSTPGGASDLHVSDEVGDLTFMCDQLKAAAQNTSDALKGIVDGLHYAVAGHSTGGAVSLLAAFAGDDALIKHDSRVSAVVPLSGDACMYGATFFKSRSVPVFAIGATNDLFVPVGTNGLWTFNNTIAPHLFAKLIGGEHTYFTDFGIPDFLLSPVPTGPTSPLATTLSTYGNGAECLPVPAAGTDPAMAIDTQHALVVQLVTAFLDSHLRQNPATLAAVIGSNNPAVVFQQ